MGTIFHNIIVDVAFYINKGIKKELTDDQNLSTTMAAIYSALVVFLKTIFKEIIDKINILLKKLR